MSPTDSATMYIFTWTLAPPLDDDLLEVKCQRLDGKGLKVTTIDNAPANIRTGIREHIAGNAEAFQTLWFVFRWCEVFGFDALAGVIGVISGHRTDALQQHHRSMVDQIGEDLPRGGAAILRQMADDAILPIVVGAAKVADGFAEVK